MAHFSARTHAEAVVLAPQQDIWDALVDPDLMARFTPFLKRITADGDHWRWEMTGLDVLGIKVAPAFTERMVFTSRTGSSSTTTRRPVRRRRPGSRAGTRFAGRPDGGGTTLVTELEITLDLPLPRGLGPGGAGRDAQGHRHDGRPVLRRTCSSTSVPRSVRVTPRARPPRALTCP